MATFTFKGVSSSTFPALSIIEMPPEQRAETTGAYYAVGGRDGYVYIGDETLKPLDKAIVITTTDPTTVTALKTWLKGAGNLELSTEPGIFYKARIAKQLDFERFLLVMDKLEILFRCQPHGYLTTGTSVVTKTTTPTTISNTGTAESKPTIKINGSGTVVLTINSIPITLTGISGYVTVDSALEDCYKDTVAKNTTMTGAFPKFIVGSNTISWTGTVTSLEITPNWRNE